MTSSTPRKTQQGHAPGASGLILLTACTLAALAVLLALGKWQLDRLAWKEDLIGKITARVGAPPTPAPAEGGWPALDVHADEYRRVTASGRYDFARQTLVHANAPKENGLVRAGYVVLTPLRLADGGVILVNRGFVPMEMRAALAGVDARTPADATVTGLLRASQIRDPFVPADDPATGEWFTRDIAAIAAAQGLQRVAPFIIDADAPARYTEGPRGGLTVISFPNRHLEYAMTWFGLAATLLGVYGVFVWRRLRERRSAPDKTPSP